MSSFRTGNAAKRHARRHMRWDAQRRSGQRRAATPAPAPGQGTGAAWVFAVICVVGGFLVLHPVLLAGVAAVGLAGMIVYVVRRRS